jgi:hypothetical protein
MVAGVLTQAPASIGLRERVLARPVRLQLVQRTRLGTRPDTLGRL